MSLLGLRTLESCHPTDIASAIQSDQKGYNRHADAELVLG